MEQQILVGVLAVAAIVSLAIQLWPSRRKF
jgi:hypothetical protein